MKTISKVGHHKEISAYQASYESLLVACNAQGTLVLKDRLIEKDQDIAPYTFYRRGTMEFIFPQQPVRLTREEQSDRDKGTGYDLTTTKQEFAYDATKVQGKIRIEYNDSENRPELRIVDTNNGSRLPKKVTAALEDILRL